MIIEIVVFRWNSIIWIYLLLFMVVVVVVLVVVVEVIDVMVVELVVEDPINSEAIIDLANMDKY